MGLAVAWIAVKGLETAAVLNRLGLADTGREVEPHQALLSLAPAADGWTVIHANDADYATPAWLAEISLGAAAVGGFIEDHVMESAARGFEDGVERWAVRHDADRGGKFHLEVSGEPPAALAPIRERLEAQQREEGGEDAEVDFLFDVPIELTKTLCGYDPNGGEAFHRELRRAEPPPPETKAKGPSLFARLFGRR